MIVKSVVDRLAWVDVAKGIGLFLVIFGHLITYGSTVFNWIFSFHMPLFFLLSGFTFKYSGSILYAIRKIILNLIVPYFLIVLVGFLISMVIPSWRPPSIRQTIVEVFYYVQPESLHIGQVWFLFGLAVVQILFVAIKNMNIKNATLEITIVSFLAVISCLYSYFCVSKLNLLRPPFKLDTALMALPFFYLGFLIKDQDFFNQIFGFLNNKLILGLIFSSFILNVFFGLVLNSTVNMAMNYYHNPIFFFISSLSGILFILLISIIINKNKILEYFGKNSLSIFSFHSLFLFLGAYAMSILYGVNFSIMKNIPIMICLFIFLLVFLLSIPIPFIYKTTIGKVLFLIKRGLDNKTN